MKLAFCNEMFQNTPLHQVFQTAAEIGYDGVEIAPFTVAPSVNEVGSNARRKIRENAAASGIEITGLHWLLLSPEGLYLNHPDDAIRDYTRLYLCDLIRFCGDLGGRVMVVGSPKQRNILSGQTYQATWDRTRKIFEDCLATAEEHDVTICLEPLDSAQTNFINTPEEAARMVREVNHLYFRMIIDVRATLCQGLDVVSAIHEQKNEIAYIHFNDANGNGPGFGETNFIPVLQALQESNYKGYGSVEVFDYSFGAENIAKISLETLQVAQLASEEKAAL